MNRKFRILITGSAGFVGSHLLNHLRKEGHDVWGIERQNNPDPKIIKADLSDHDGTINEFKDHGSFQIVIHTAAKKKLSRNSQNIRDFSLNNTITANVISLSERWKPHVIMMSSVSVYGEAGTKTPIKPSAKLEPSDSYGKSKIICENLLNSCQIINTTILRLSPVYSDNNLSNVEKRVIPVKKANMKLKVFPSPLHSFCHIDSLKNTISNILDNTGKSTINVVDNTPYSQKEIYQWFKGFPIPIHVFMVLPIYWITFVLPKSIGYKIRRTWSKLFASNIYEN